MSAITIDVRRFDGDVTRLEGVAGVSVVMGEDVPIVDPTDAEALVAAVKDMPVVSLRADNSAQLAVMLGCLMATIAEVAPEALDAAAAVALITNARDPRCRRDLPPRPSK